MRSVLLTFLLLLPGIAGAQIPVLNVSTAKLSFITSGMSKTAPTQQVRIRNIGSGSLMWRATTSTPWIRVSPAEGSAPGTLTVTIETGALLTGDYTGRVTVTAVGDADDSPAQIDVSLKLVPASKAPPEPAPADPAPAAGSTGGAASGRADAAAALQDDQAPVITMTSPANSRSTVTSEVEIGAPPGTRAIVWTARVDVPWLTVEPSRGTTPATVRLKASPIGLPPGDARATVQFLDGAGATILAVPIALSIGGDPRSDATGRAGGAGGASGRGATTAAGRSGARGPDRQTTPLFIPPTALPPATRNMPYSQALPVSGGTPPYGFQLLQGRLPPGLTLANGAIAGVCRAPGTYQFVIGVADSSVPQPQRVAQPMAIRVITIFQDTALMVMPPAVAINVLANVRQQPVRLNITSGAQALDWHVETDAPWLRLVPSDGISPGIVQLEVAAQTLAPGSYMATITVSMEGVPNSPARIPVQVFVRK
jgi:hypothetical protein